MLEFSGAFQEKLLTNSHRKFLKDIPDDVLEDITKKIGRSSKNLLPKKFSEEFLQAIPERLLEYFGDNLQEFLDYFL